MTSFRVPFFVSAVLLAALSQPARAEQFVLFDVTFPFSKMDADNSTPSKSHYYVKGDAINPKRPKDWTSPVDYRNGTVHIRLEVFDRPDSGEEAIWNLCYIPNKGQKNGYGCTATAKYTKKGVYENDVPMTRFWENDSILWEEGIKQMDLVYKDGKNLHAHKREDPEKFFPTRVRITMVQVSAGSKYDPTLVPNLPPAPKAQAPADAQAFPDPPDSINAERPGIPHGKLEMIEYDSKTVGTRRKLNVYTPPGYSPEKRYPVLYLLHGIGGDETEWARFAKPHLLMDNLIADGKATPMIVVMPNGRAQKNDRAEGNVFAAAPAFAVFERDLLDDVIPAIEARYSVDKKREARAIAGLSMGGGQSLNFGLGNLGTFAWVGGFSSAPNTKQPAVLLPDPAAAKQKLKLLYLSCGNKDGLLRISQGVRDYLKVKEVPHLWNLDGHGHDPTHWRNNLYHFLQRVFR